jgi:hypothetical protein
MSVASTMGPPTAAHLVNVACSRVKDSEHRHKAIASAFCAFNVGPFSTYVMHTEPYATSSLADLSALLQSVIDAAYAVVAAAVVAAAAVVIAAVG